MPFCSKCGNEIAENVNFCTKCGNANNINISSIEEKGNADKGSDRKAVAQATFHLKTEKTATAAFWFWFETIGLLCGAFSCLYFGGWKLAWGVMVWKAKGFVSEGLILGDLGILLQFNNGYYGLQLTNRYFYSPVISWFLGSLGVFLLAMFFKEIFGKIFDE